MSLFSVPAKLVKTLKGEQVGAGGKWGTMKGGRAFPMRTPGLTHCLEFCEESAKHVDKRHSAGISSSGF